MSDENHEVIKFGYAGEEDQLSREFTETDQTISIHSKVNFYSKQFCKICDINGSFHDPVWLLHNVSCCPYIINKNGLFLYEVPTRLTISKEIIKKERK